MMRFRKLWGFLKRDAWSRDLADFPPLQRMGLYVLRALVLTVHGLISRNVSIFASSLTFVTLITAIPFMALVIGATTKIGASEQIFEFIEEVVPRGQEESDIVGILRSASNGIANTDLRAFGLVAVVLLVWAMLRMLYRIEQGMNQTWGVERKRGGVRRFFVYLLLVVVGPVLILIAVVLTTSLKSTEFVTWMLSQEIAQGIWQVLVPYFPYIAILVALTLFYQLMPYTRVRWHAAFAGGLVAAGLWQVAQQAFLSAQLGIGRFNLVFGALAAVPIFLMWIYITWMIVFTGAQVSYGIQHARTLHLEITEDAEEPGKEQSILTALRVAVYLASQPRKNGRVSTDDIAQDLGLPHRRVNRILTTLEERKLVRGTRSDRCRLTRPPEQVTANQILASFVEQAGEVPEDHDVPVGVAAAILELIDSASRTLDVPLTEILPADLESDVADGPAQNGEAAAT